MIPEPIAATAVDDAITALRAHPVYDRIVRIYRNALIDWNASGPIQNAAATLGMDRRAYADSRLHANQFSWLDNGTGNPLTQAHFEQAYLDAVEQAGV